MNEARGLKRFDDLGHRIALEEVNLLVTHPVKFCNGIGMSP